MNEDNQENSGFAAAAARAKAQCNDASKSQCWTTVKSVAESGLYLGVFIGTVIIVTSVAKAATAAVFGSNK